MIMSLKLHIVVIKSKYERKYYYKKCVTQKILDTKHKILNSKHYYLRVSYLSLVRGQYLYSQAKPRDIVLELLVL